MDMEAHPEHTLKTPVSVSVPWTHAGQLQQTHLSGDSIFSRYPGTLYLIILLTNVLSCGINVQDTPAKTCAPPTAGTDSNPSSHPLSEQTPHAKFSVIFP